MADWYDEPRLRHMLDDFKRERQFHDPTDFALTLAMRLLLTDRQQAGVADPLSETRPLRAVLVDLAGILGTTTPIYLQTEDVSHERR
jgi:hypothetical protein